jgi:hypothetical protein
MFDKIANKTTSGFYGNSLLFSDSKTLRRRQTPEVGHKNALMLSSGNYAKFERTSFVVHHLQASLMLAVVSLSPKSQEPLEE